MLEGHNKVSLDPSVLWTAPTISAVLREGAPSPDPPHSLPLDTLQQVQVCLALGFPQPHAAPLESRGEQSSSLTCWPHFCGLETSWKQHSVDPAGLIHCPRAILHIPDTCFAHTCWHMDGADCQMPFWKGIDCRLPSQQGFSQTTLIFPVFVMVKQGVPLSPSFAGLQLCHCSQQHWAVYREMPAQPGPGNHSLAAPSLLCLLSWALFQLHTTDG